MDAEALSILYICGGFIAFYSTIFASDSFAESIAAAFLWPAFLIIMICHGAVRLYERIIE